MNFDPGLAPVGAVVLLVLGFVLLKQGASVAEWMVLAAGIAAAGLLLEEEIRYAACCRQADGAVGKKPQR